MNCLDFIVFMDFIDNYQLVVEIIDGLVLIKENGDDILNFVVLIEDLGVVFLYQVVFFDFNFFVVDYEQNEI